MNTTLTTLRSSSLRSTSRAAAACVLGVLAMSVVGARGAETGRVFVKSTPSGAQVFLDDEKEPRAKTPCILRDVPAGTHVLRGHLEGHVDVRQEIEVEAGALGRASLTFAVESGAAKGTVVVKRERVPAGEPAALEEKKPTTPASDEPERYIHVDCPVCSGTGLLQEMGCPTCNGTGWVGFRRCAECGGTRKVEYNCPYCRGAGVVTRGGEEKDCSKCKGKGKLACPVCRATGKLKRNNPEFSAKPTMSCPYCQGSGFVSDVKCIRCSGKGTFQSGESTGGGIYTYVNTNCPFCGGDGEGPPLCRRCRGTGVLSPKKNPVICASCFGTGQMFRPCRPCKGKGWIRSQ